MAWIDDRIWCHQKFTDLSGDAFTAYVKAIAYSSGMSTGGHLTMGQIKMIGATHRETAALVAVGLWEPNGDGIHIHDWDEHNGKRDERKAKDRERKRASRSTGQSTALSTGASAGQSADKHEDGSALTTRRRAPDDGSEGSEGSEKKNLSPKHSRPTSSPEDVQRVYEHWRSTRGKTHSTYATISDNRRKKIQSRLREFSADELCSAIDAVARDPWPDRAHHDDITIIFRSREQVEKFLEMPAFGGKTTNLNPYDAAKAWVVSAGWRFPDEDLLDELGRRFGMEGEQKTRLAEIAYGLQKGAPDE